MNRDECILFTGYIMPNGYGQKWSTTAQTRTTAHRAAWMEKHGLIPDDVYVLHKCDVLYDVGDVTYRRCINLEHLYVGSQQDNLSHMHELGRGNQSRPGERHGMAKLKEADVLAIRASYKPYDRICGATALARKYNVDKSTVRRILGRKIWTHL